MNNRIRVALLVVVVVLAGTAAGTAGAFRGNVPFGHAAIVAREQENVVRFARRYLGVPYRYGGASPATGFDCSGFTRFVFEHFGVVLPHDASAQFGLGRRVSPGSLRPGDLLFFDGLAHVGLYVGDDRFIDAPHTGTRVEINTLSGWYLATFDGARRVV